jgi:glutathione synthase/RimK-type ligase-like ATP-grasp enzyme
MIDVAIISGTDTNPVPQDDLLLIEHLALKGVSAKILAWDSCESLVQVPTIGIVRSAWNYPRMHEAFISWVEKFSSQTLLLNSADTIKWNLNKHYLASIEQQGVAVVPTQYLPRLDEGVIFRIMDDMQWTEVVIKPEISVGAQGLFRFSRIEPARLEQFVELNQAFSGFLVQPYLEAVKVHGEISVCIIDGSISCVIQKMPAHQEYRVQEKFGGQVRKVPSTPTVERIAKLCLEASGFKPLYARVDLLPGATGELYVSELELIEPDLYLRYSPEALVWLGEAILKRLRNIATPKPTSERPPTTISA